MCLGKSARLGDPFQTTTDLSFWCFKLSGVLPSQNSLSLEVDTNGTNRQDLAVVQGYSEGHL